MSMYNNIFNKRIGSYISCQKSRTYLALFAHGLRYELQCPSTDAKERLCRLCDHLCGIYTHHYKLCLRTHESQGTVIQNGGIPLLIPEYRRLSIIHWSFVAAQCLQSYDHSTMHYSSSQTDSGTDPHRIHPVRSVHHAYPARWCRRPSWQGSDPRFWS